MTILPALPILLPMATALVLSLLRNSPSRSHGVALGGAALHLAVAIHLLTRVLKHDVAVLWVGSWPAPFSPLRLIRYFSATSRGQSALSAEAKGTGGVNRREVATAAVVGLHARGRGIRLCPQRRRGSGARGP